MIFTKFACRNGRHKWVFNGREYTVDEVMSGNFESFCIACGKTKSGPRHAATKAVSAWAR